VYKHLPGTSLESNQGSFSDSTSKFVAKTAFELCVGIVVTKQGEWNDSINVFVLIELELDSRDYFFCCSHSRQHCTVGHTGVQRRCVLSGEEQTHDL
jgi:hypothetical protein